MMSPWWNSKERWQKELGIEPDPPVQPLWKFLLLVPLAIVGGALVLVGKLLGSDQSMGG